MEKTLFGTDGIRGAAGQPPLDPLTIACLGRCLGRHLQRSGTNISVVLGLDTRESGPWIAAALSAALRQTGAAVAFPGVIPTPGLAYLTVAGKFSAGVMVSASHNPFQDNGIKIFGPDGYKLPDADEIELERKIHSEMAELADRPPSAAASINAAPESLAADAKILEPYLEHLREIARGVGQLPGRRAVIDCANGAATAVAREVFSAIPYDWVYIGDRPDGRNINLGCGSLHLDLLRNCVAQSGADWGVAFDGDADRALFVDAHGKIVDGDSMLLAAARYMKRTGALRGAAIVGTLMTNLGLERALENEGLILRRAAVGDKYVLEEMQRCGANLGGEQSGHIIFSDRATTGDGLLTALQMLAIMAAEGKPLDELVAGLHVFPQNIRNVSVRERVPLEQLAGFQQQLRASEQSLGARGRIVVRYSGTELLARIMVEAETAELVAQHTSTLEKALIHALRATRPASVQPAGA